MSRTISQTFLPYNSAQLFSARNPQFLALLFTALIHASIAAWAIFPFSPTVISQQTIQVSFVAPNSQKKQSENNSHEKFVPLTEKKNALKQQKKTDAPQPKQEKQIAESQVEKHTTGRVNDNAVATKSADSDPVFDAAYLNNPTPYYPQSAKSRGIQGKVMLEVTVKTDGTPLNIRIIKSSGSSALDEAALNAVHDWKFMPARRAGEVVQANVIVPVEFKLI